VPAGKVRKLNLGNILNNIIGQQDGFRGDNQWDTLGKTRKSKPDQACAQIADRDIKRCNEWWKRLKRAG